MMLIAIYCTFDWILTFCLLDKRDQIGLNMSKLYSIDAKASNPLEHVLWISNSFEWFKCHHGNKSGPAHSNNTQNITAF